MQRCQKKQQRLFTVLTCRVLSFIIITKQLYQVQIFKYLPNILPAVCLSSVRSSALYKRLCSEKRHKFSQL